MQREQKFLKMMSESLLSLAEGNFAVRGSGEALCSFNVNCLELFKVVSKY